MDREEAIRHIEALYPADSVYDDTAEIGRELLEQARREVSGWRYEATGNMVLACLAINTLQDNT